MKIEEWGTENREVVVLLHGGGLSWWNYREAAALLQARYHAVAPILDGHAGSGRDFESVEAAAWHLLEWIDASFGGKIFALCGLSLGAQTAIAAMAERPDLCRYALIESAALIPDRLTGMMIPSSFSVSYPLIRQNWFSRLQFQSLHIQPSLYEDYYADTCRITKENLIAFTKASVLYSLPAGIADSQAKILAVVGEKELPRMKRSAQLLKKAKPDTKITIARGLYHGELSLNHPDQYVKLLTDWIQESE